jgi:hypothetical protein
MEEVLRNQQHLYLNTVCMIDLDADIKFQLRFGASKLSSNGTAASVQLLTKYSDAAKTFNLLSLKV